MVHPAIGAAFLGGGFAGMASRHVGTLNVISGAVGTLTGIWVAQNHPGAVPNLKEELRRFARHATDAEDLQRPGTVPAIEGFDRVAAGDEVADAMGTLAKARADLRNSEARMHKLEQQLEMAHSRLNIVKQTRETTLETVKDIERQAGERIVARMVQLKLERKDRSADRQKIERQLEVLRRLRDQELKG